MRRFTPDAAGVQTGPNHSDRFDAPAHVPQGFRNTQRGFALNCVSETGDQRRLGLMIGLCDGRNRASEVEIRLVNKCSN